MRRSFTMMLAGALVASLLGAPGAGAQACAPDPVAEGLVGAGLVHYTEDPGAGAWRTWFVDPVEVDVPPPPPITSAAGVAELGAVATAFRVNHLSGFAPVIEEPVARWTTRLLELITTYSSAPDRNPPRLSRQIAMFQTAVADALVVAWRAKYCYLRPPPSALDPVLLAGGAPRSSVPSYPSEHATVAGVAAVMLSSFFPEEGSSLEEEAALTAQRQVAAGANYPSDVEAGLELGRTIAWRVIGARASDGWNATWDGAGRITGTCRWSPTPPAFAYPPAEPMWGTVDPWLMPAGDALRPSPPPACDGDDYLAAARDVYEASKTLTDRQREIALHWAGGPGTETPPGMNLRVALEHAAGHGLTTMRRARLLGYVGAVLADAAIAAWDAKYASWADRPVTTIRRLWDKHWSPLIATPPFPGYVSGHATFSGATARVLEHFFPDDAVVFRAMASEAALSRFYTGIHARYDNEAGLVLGEGIGSLAAERAAVDGA